MKLTQWWTRQEPELFDYSTLLIKVEKLERKIHDSCLHKDYDKVPAMIDDAIEQMILLKKWVKTQ